LKKSRLKQTLKKIKPRKQTEAGTPGKLQVTPTYAVLEVRDLPCETESELTSFLFSCGCQGTEQVLKFEQGNLQYEPEVIRTSLISMRGYFEEASVEHASLAIQGWIQSKTPGTSINWKIEKHRDWLGEWKKYFKSFAIGGFWVEPSWAKPSKRGKNKMLLRVEPGMAFGTGTHATTQFALSLLESLSKKEGFDEWFVADVGAGSGILSVAAERLGALQVDAIDNDPVAWRVARENFQINKTKRCHALEAQVGDLGKNYDLVLANIIDGVLMQIGTHLRRIVKPGGYLILSGILTAGARAFIRDFFDNEPFEVLEMKSDSEWTACLARHKKDPPN